MAKVTKQLTDAEKIRNEILAVESAEEMKNEEKLLKRLIALQKKVDERNQRKKTAVIQARILTKDSIVEIVLSTLKKKADFDECNKLSDFDNLKKDIENTITFYYNFYKANKNLPGIGIPEIDGGDVDTEDEKLNSEKEEVEEVKEEGGKIDSEIMDSKEVTAD